MGPVLCNPSLTSTTDFVDGGTAFHHACIEGHGGVVNLLLSEGRDLIEFNTPSLKNERMTGFHFACYFGHQEVVSTMVAKGRDVIDFHAQVHLLELGPT